MQNYAVQGWISEGRFGTVSRAIDKRNGEEVAIKEIYFREASRRMGINSVIVDDAWTKSILREIQCLAANSDQTDQAIRVLQRAVEGFGDGALKHAKKHGKIRKSRNSDNKTLERRDETRESEKQGFDSRRMESREIISDRIGGSREGYTNSREAHGSKGSKKSTGRGSKDSFNGAFHSDKELYPSKEKKSISKERSTASKEKSSSSSADNVDFYNVEKPHVGQKNFRVPSDSDLLGSPAMSISYSSGASPFPQESPILPSPMPPKHGKLESLSSGKPSPLIRDPPGSGFRNSPGFLPSSNGKSPLIVTGKSPLMPLEGRSPLLIPLDPLDGRSPLMPSEGKNPLWHLQGEVDPDEDIRGLTLTDFFGATGKENQAGYQEFNSEFKPQEGYHNNLCGSSGSVENLTRGPPHSNLAGTNLQSNRSSPDNPSSSGHPCGSSPECIVTHSSLNSHPKNSKPNVTESLKTSKMRNINASTPDWWHEQRSNEYEQRTAERSTSGGKIATPPVDGGLDDDNDGVDWHEWNKQYNEGAFKPEALREGRGFSGRENTHQFQENKMSNLGVSLGKVVGDTLLWVAGMDGKTSSTGCNSNRSGMGANLFLLDMCTSNAGIFMRNKQKRHPNVITLLEHFASENHPSYHLVYEACEIDLSQLCEIPKREAKKLSLQLLNGLVELHENRGVIHRDLKPANLLLHRSGLLKIADFGSARQMLSGAPRDWHDCTRGNQQYGTIEEMITIEPLEGERFKDRRERNRDSAGIVESDAMTREICTRWYKSPEQLFGSYTYDEKVDIWSFGLVTYELLNDSPLFDGACDIEQLGKIFHVLGSVDPSQWPEAKDLPDFGKILFKHIPVPPNEYMDRKPFKKNSLIDCCIRLNPKSRPGASRLMSHIWYRKIKSQAMPNNNSSTSNYSSTTSNPSCVGVESGTGEGIPRGRHNGRNMPNKKEENHAPPIPYQGLYNLSQKRKKMEEDKSEDSYPDEPFSPFLEEYDKTNLSPKKRSSLLTYSSKTKFHPTSSCASSASEFETTTGTEKPTDTEKLETLEKPEQEDESPISRGPTINIDKYLNSVEEPQYQEREKQKPTVDSDTLDQYLSSTTDRGLSSTTNKGLSSTTDKGLISRDSVRNHDFLRYIVVDITKLKRRTKGNTIGTYFGNEKRRDSWNAEFEDDFEDLLADE